MKLTGLGIIKGGEGHLAKDSDSSDVGSGASSEAPSSSSSSDSQSSGYSSTSDDSSSDGPKKPLNLGLKLTGLGNSLSPFPSQWFLHSTHLTLQVLSRAASSTLPWRTHLTSPTRHILLLISNQRQTILLSRLLLDLRRLRAQLMALQLLPPRPLLLLQTPQTQRTQRDVALPVLG